MRPHLILSTISLLFCSVLAKADTIDRLTLTTSAFDATNVTSVSYVEGTFFPRFVASPVQVDSDPTKTAAVYYAGSAFTLTISDGSQRGLTYYGSSSQVATRILGDASGEGTFAYAFNPGSYSLSYPTVTLSSGGTLQLDSATLEITKVVTDTTSPPVVPTTPVSGVAVTPEPSSLALLGTGLLGIGSILKRRMRGIF